MDEQDKKILDDLNELRITFNLKVVAAKRAEGNWAGCDDCDERYYPTQDNVKSLEATIILIERLDKQLTEIKEAGKFLDELVQLADKDDKPDDDYWLMDGGGGKLSEVEIGQIRRLVQALKEANG